MLKQWINLLPFKAAKGLFDPDTELSPEKNGSSSHPPILLLSGPLQHYLPSVPRAFRRALSFRISDQNSCCISHFYYECYMPDTSHTPWFDYNSSWWQHRSWNCEVCNYLPCRSKYPPQHTVLTLYLWSSISATVSKFYTHTILSIFSWVLFVVNGKIKHSVVKGNKHLPRQICY